MAEDPPITFRQEVLNKLKTTLSESFYREAIENSSNYNNRLVVERKTRLPFIDSQTGVAQNDCFLWMQKWERMPGMTDGQVYSYPVRRWKKKRRQYLLNHKFQPTAAPKADQMTNNSIENTNGNASSFELNGTNGMEIIAVSQNAEESNDSKFFAERESRSDSNWATEFEDASDIPDAAELDDDSDFDDYEDFGSRKKRRKKAETTVATTTTNTPGRRRKITMDPNHEKPFQCDICKMRYKTRPGLTYHHTHIHANENADSRRPTLDEEDSQASNTGPASNGKAGSSTSNSPLPPITTSSVNTTGSNPAASNSNSRLASAGASTGGGSSHNHMASPVPPSPSQNSNSSSSANPKNGEESKEGGKPRKSNPPSSYCDFCLGNSEINKKTKSSEEMISCSDCGRSAHPTCLQFTANMILSVKKYRWQCIECKSCGLCGTSDNDDQLLFCDDCDRGYHMYCLKPPLREPPEGSWSCHLCIVEYHQPKSENGGNGTSQTKKISQSANNSKSNHIPSVAGQLPPSLGAPQLPHLLAQMPMQPGMINHRMIPPGHPLAPPSLTPTAFGANPSQQPFPPTSTSSSHADSQAHLPAPLPPTSAVVGPGAFPPVSFAGPTPVLHAPTNGTSSATSS